MYLLVPEEIRQLRQVFMPFVEGCRLKKDAPKEAVEALEKFLEWFDKEQGLEQ